MKILAIIGDPIKQAQSPATFDEYFRTHHIDGVMVPLHVAANDFRAVLAGLRLIQNFVGTVVTIPHKPLAYQVAHTRGVMAEATQAANVLVPYGTDQWSAEMFDGVGFISALQKRNIPVTGLRVLLIGAGGAGTAIAVALERLGQVAGISIVEPDRDRAAELVAKLENAEIGKPDPEGYQVIVNASPVGMRTEDVPLDASRCTPGTIVCDAIMDPARTRFLLEAEKQGCVVVPGLEMLHGQVEPLARFMGLVGKTRG